MPSVPIDSITIGTDRQRKDLGDLSKMKASIALRGLIQPICITKAHLLVAGERRLRACKELGHKDIEAKYLEDCSPLELQLIEAAENRDRLNFSPREDHNSIMRSWALLKQLDPNVTQDRVADECNISRPNVSQHKLVEEWRLRDPKIDAALNRTFDAAFKLASDARERWEKDTKLAVTYQTIAAKVDSAIHDIVAALDPAHDAAPLESNYTHPTVPYHPIEVITEDFTEWAPRYTGQPFNLIHCDFPYGINSHDHEGQNSANQVRYWDSPETWNELCRTFVKHLDRFCAPSAHLIFWFAAERYCETWTMLSALPGFVFDPYPLIWRRGKNEGVAPDPTRRPRRIYEMAFFGWRDRKLGTDRAKANLYEAPTDRDEHRHEKSEEMLGHFFSMLVSDTTRLLDPTCGSGSALRAAQSLGVKQMLGIEINPGYAAQAQLSLDRMYQGEGDIDLDSLGLCPLTH